jgi:hypothetical protein
LDSPTYVINGKTLTFAQGLCIHVAIQNFLMDLADPEFRAALGEELASSYAARLREVNNISLGGQ